MAVGAVRYVDTSANAAEIADFQAPRSTEHKGAFAMPS